MKRSTLPLVFLLAILLATFARAQTQPSTQPAPVNVNLAELRALSLQDRQTIKTWDSFARQVIAAISGRSTLDDREPLYTLLDIAFRPESYADRPLIKVKHLPLAQDIAAMPGLSKEESKRIVEKGTVSLSFWTNPQTQSYLRQLQQDAINKSEAIGAVQNAAGALQAIMDGGPSLRPMSFVPPVSADGEWHNLTELHGNIARLVGDEHGPILEGYDDTKLAKLVASISGLREGWITADAARAQKSIDTIVDVLPGLGATYPTASRRHVEVLYNKLYKLTLPGAALYFVAFTLFLVAAYSEGGSLRKWGVGFMAAGWLLHTVGIAIRWWLDQNSTGDWFHSIPIKNQFESVMMSAWFGVGVGLGLEFWKRKSLFGAAASFVGWMSLVALFTVPYVWGKDIGGEIGRVNGILMSYWLYIHVTMATASYALIGMSFLLGAWWLVGYLTKAEKAPAFLGLLDSCNLVILQLAFWILGFAIVCGAIWADVSWGRPWGWDPKETFALVTWIVYLIVLHVRLVTREKALWTSVLSIVGFFVMLFNWIGVNYFLVGLHSYA